MNMVYQSTNTVYQWKYDKTFGFIKNKLSTIIRIDSDYNINFLIIHIINHLMIIVSSQSYVFSMQWFGHLLYTSNFFICKLCSNLQTLTDYSNKRL